jgi:hypothetical protein
LPCHGQWPLPTSKVKWSEIALVRLAEIGRDLE